MITFNVALISLAHCLAVSILEAKLSESSLNFWLLIAHCNVEVKYSTALKTESHIRHVQVKIGFKGVYMRN